MGSGLEITVKEYAEALIRKLGKEIEPLIPGQYRVGDNRHSVSDVSKLMALGWAPRYGLQKIFDDYVAWIEEQGELGKYFEEADAAMKEQGVVKKANKT